MGVKPTQKHTIDRIDRNLGYFPENCRWATQKEQQNNRVTNVLVEFEGRSQNLKQWALEAGIPYKSFWRRIKAGWDFQKALTTPIRNNHGKRSN
jgi:hypothetical protein